MKVQVLFFGELEEITGCSHRQVQGVEDTMMLTDIMVADYPALANRKYLLAVNEQVVDEKIFLQDADVVAFLPPYSGG